MPTRWASIATLIRSSFRREHLPPPPTAPVRAGQAPRGLLQAILGAEPLALDPERAPEREGRRLLGLLLGPEPLGSEPASAGDAAPRRGLLRALLGPETLGQDPEPPPRAHRRRGSLFLPERLDPP